MSNLVGINWELKGFLKKLIPPVMMINGVEKKMAVRNCMTFSVENNGSSGVKKYVENRARWYGLNTCKFGNMCPSCGQLKRGSLKVILENTITAHVAAGGSVMLVTFTNSNGRDQKLVETWDRLKLADKALHRHFSRNSLKKEWGVIGVVKAPEETCGKVNGWHPHSHQLWFFDGSSDVTMEEVRGALFPVWKKQCRNKGLGKPLEFAIDGDGNKKGLGVNVQSGDKAGGYIVKPNEFDISGLAAEVTYGQNKSGRMGNFTPFELVQIAVVNDDKWAKMKFLEFVEASWSRSLVTGLKQIADLYGTFELTEEQILELEGKRGDLVLDENFDRFMTRRILKNNLKAEVLGWFDKGVTRERVEELIYKLTKDWIDPVGGK